MRHARLLVAAAILLFSAGFAAPLARGHGCAYPARVHVGFGFGYSPWWGYPAWGYGGYGGYGWWGGYPYPAYAPAYGSYAPTVGWADTDISPGKARVYLDGEYVGTADDFDGFPSYLTLEPGRHTIAFGMEGYKSISRSVNVHAGQVLSFDAKMQKGVTEGNDEIQLKPQHEEPPAAAPPAEQPPAGPGYIRVQVTPGDASVYLDGAFFANGDAMARLHGDIRLDAGTHTVEAVRPGYRTARRTVTLAPEERATVTLELEQDR